MSSTLLEHSFSHGFCKRVSIWVKSYYLKLMFLKLLRRHFHNFIHKLLWIFILRKRINFLLDMTSLVRVHIGSRDVSKTHHTLRLFRQLQHPWRAEVVYTQCLLKRVVKVDARSAINYYFNLGQQDFSVCQRKSKSLTLKISRHRSYFMTPLCSHFGVLLKVWSKQLRFEDFSQTLGVAHAFLWTDHHIQ